MDALPIFINVRQRHCVVIGGGDVATRKIRQLLKAGARVACYAPDFSESLDVLAADATLVLHRSPFLPEQLAGAWLVIAATDDEAVNQQVSEAANALGIPVNVVDTPALCSFTMPAIVDRSPVIVAISSAGAAPVLARLVRAQIETMIPANFGRLAALARDFRQQVKERFSESAHRRYFWEKAFQGPIAEMVFSGQESAARNALQIALDCTSAEVAMGEVYLVGGGPGDPDLLTFRALRLMQQCDVCVYDKLVSDEVLNLVRRDAELIYVGKARDRHTLPQQEINVLLSELAKAGKRVLRLKGGDPFIFGRGGEEIETLMAEGVPFQVVPGISAANGVASYAGIPLTHRDYAHSCLFITGHLKDGTVELDWTAMTRPKQTVVIYMGLVGLAQICQQLILHGLSQSMPAAVIEQGTTRRQRVLVADLETLAEKASTAAMQAPCLIIVGEVVGLRDKLNWFNP